ncbi:uncharacterized protein LOC119788849 [Cyprinodon tularosa]|uniref:uncharacterized protein LOC119788849 n=1 Tax=Cyprinodon tularosa TaxID=77115 RepID=UPI0018E25BD8|nr:uncharacterized protein LOC119788849 [Cyprinodon tularosa]
MSASTVLLLLQLQLLASLVSASHHWGGTMNYAYKGRNPDGSFKMVLRGKDTYDSCSNYHSWSCYTGNCGSVTSRKITTIDLSTNTPSYESQWCETENVETWRVPSDKPFQLRVASCCWITTRNSVSDWRLESLVDLGTRSDTGEPNRSPDIAVLPFIRVPQNCPRTYKMAVFDADGDEVMCRYGNLQGIECDVCSLPSGFSLDSDSCTLRYQSTSADSSIFAFEMVVEDFARNRIDLSYSDGSKTSKSALLSRGKTEGYTAGVYAGTLPAATVSPTSWGGAEPSYNTTAGNPPSPGTTSFAQNRNGSPLSKLPLQFAFLVDPVVPSCQEGQYLPQLVAPTPAEGERILAEVNKEVEIRVKAQATHSSIQSIVISGPTNITKHKDTNNEFVIRWTPVPDDLGEHYPVCFAVESVSGSSVYQSEMRCVLVEIRKKQIEATVTCTESTMKVEVKKASFFGLEEDHLQLNDPSNTICSLDRLSNSTHIVAIIPLNECGTQIEEDDDYLIFKNEITTVEDDPNEIITRKHLVEARFYCQYPKRGNVTLNFSAHRKNVTVWEKGFGTFTYQFEFYQDDQFEAMFDPNSYPLEFDIGNRIYMQLDASSSVNNTEMFVESCRAAPYDNPNYRPTYSIIENGCAVDSTVQTYPTSNERLFQFSMEAFKFIGLHDQVYISCTVMMCEAGNPNTRCSQGCMNSTWSHFSSRRKRETVVQSGKHLVSQGPLRLRRAADPSRGTELNLNPNLVFVVGCLFAAVGMVCGVLLYKTKTSRVKYQSLPSYEN